MDQGIAGESGLRPADLFTLFVANHRRALPPTRGKRFNAGEHLWLASHGAQRACESLKGDLGIDIDPGMFDSIRQKSGREELQYGELVALSGDFYETPEELFDEKPSRFSFIWEANNLSGLREIFAEELDWIEERRSGHGIDTYPQENIRLAWNAKSYVELALRNTDHFGWHNMVRYVACHAQALELARDAGGNDEKLRRALYVNAFADHFLTDGFAAGHVRVPRAEICDWAAARGLDDKVAGSLSKLLHDQDGHVATLHGNVHELRCRGRDDGLRVRNAVGTSWYTYCDGQLFLDPDASASMAVQSAVDAVAASVRELMLAWKQRKIPNGVFAATRLVPFPHPAAQTLTDKFCADLPHERIDALWQSVAWYSKVPWLAGLKKAHVVDLFRDLPDIMRRFREHVAQASQAADVQLRVAPSYIDAYCEVA